MLAASVVAATVTLADLPAATGVGGGLGFVVEEEGLLAGALRAVDADPEEAVETGTVTGSEAMLRSLKVFSMTAGDMARIDKSGAMAK